MSVQTQGYINAGVEGNHLIGLGGLPTIVLGPGAGAGSAIITGTDTACTVVLTVGAGSTNNSIVFTVNFNTPYLAIPHTTNAPGDANAAASNTRMWVNNIGLTSFTMNITNPALKTGQVYTWHFISIG